MIIHVVSPSGNPIVIVPGGDTYRRLPPAVAVSLITPPYVIF
jgi:hypothetical protein